MLGKQPVGFPWLVLLLAATSVLDQQAVSNKPGFVDAVKRGKAGGAASFQ